MTLHSAVGTLLAGDALHVAQDRRHVSFMYSVPNHVPARPALVRETPVEIEVFGFGGQLPSGVATGDGRYLLQFNNVMELYQLQVVVLKWVKDSTQKFFKQSRQLLKFQ